MNTCIDCKYFKNENCTHPYKDDCENCSLWWPKEGARYIDADKLIERIGDVPLWNGYFEPYPFEVHLALVEIRKAMLDTINAMSTVNVEEVKYGEWILYKPMHYKCSVCGKKVGGKISNHCPECGAKNGRR